MSPRALPLDHWPNHVLMARARVLLLYLDPDSPVPKSRKLRRVYWDELRRVLTELDMRGMQGKLL